MSRTNATYVQRLALTDWRNYAQAEIEFAPGASVLVGSNGQGKTNLVEAIGYLATLGSHRVAGDQSLIRTGADQAVIRATVSEHGRAVLAEVLLNRQGPNRAQLNRTAVRPREITRTVRSVLFAPEDLALVRGEPSARRRYQDELLVAQTPRLAGAVADYDKTLRQRNGLLRAARAGGRFAADLATLDAWDERLAVTGAEVIAARERLVAALGPVVAERYAVIAGAGQGVELAPVLSIDDEGMPPADGQPAASVRDRFDAALRRVRTRELERGTTLVGPHRDDLELRLNGLPARQTASHGESWSLALALRLAAADLLREDSPVGDPIVVLDDVFAELDERRRDRLAEQVAGFEQVLITAAVAGDVPAAVRGAVTRISHGTIGAADSAERRVETPS